MSVDVHFAAQERVLDVVLETFPVRTFHRPGDFDHEHIAWMVCMRSEKSEQSFGFSLEIEELEAVARHAGAALVALSRLSTWTKRSIPSSDATKAIAAALTLTELYQPAIDAQAHLESLGRWANEMKKRPYFKKTASRKLNWRAASATQACRVAWGIAAWHRDAKNPSSSFTDAEFERYRRFVWDEAPMFEKEPPGPFGRFCEKIFEALGVLDSEGNPVTAASALRSWRTASGQKHRT